MKHLILTIISAIALTAGAQPGKPQTKASVRCDTLAQAYTADSVMLYQNSNVVMASLYGVDGDSISMVTVSRLVTTSDSATADPWVTLYDKYAERFPHKKHKASHWSYIIGGIGFGFSQVCGAPKGTAVQFFKSLDLNILYLSGAKYTVPGTRNSINIGVGVDWRRYRATYPAKCFVSTDGVIGLGDYPAEVIPKYSQLRTFSITLPILWRQQLPLQLPGCATMSLAVGPVVDFNVHGNLNNVWINLEGNKVTESTSHIGKKTVTVELFGALYVNSWLGMYLRYTPMPILHKPNMQFSAFSAGLLCSF